MCFLTSLPLRLLVSPLRVCLPARPLVSLFGCWPPDAASPTLASVFGVLNDRPVGGPFVVCVCSPARRCVCSLAHLWICLTPRCLHLLASSMYWVFLAARRFLTATLLHHHHCSSMTSVPLLRTYLVPHLGMLIAICGVPCR